MTYVKLPKTVTDVSSGIQSVNQLRDNFGAVGDGYSLEHSAREPIATQGGIAYPPLPLSFGRHDTPKVCRAVVRSTTTTGFAVALPGATLVAPCVTRVTHVAVGVFFIGIADLNEFYAVCDPEQSSATPQRFALPQSGFGGNGAPVGIVVQCFEKSGTAFVLTDYDWSAHIYGTVA